MEQTRTDHPWTDDELMALSSAGHRVELTDGVLHDMSPGGGRHGVVVVTISELLLRYARKHRAGAVFGADTGYRLDDANCLAPDISFVSAARLRQLWPDPGRFLIGAPDLAVEVLSPSDSWTHAERKVALYLHHGTRQAWIVDPEARIIRVYAGPNRFVTLAGADRLPVADLFPGLDLPVSALFCDLPDQAKSPRG